MSLWNPLLWFCSGFHGYAFQTLSILLSTSVSSDPSLFQMLSGSRWFISIQIGEIFSSCFLLSFQPSEASRPFFLIPSRKWERIYWFFPLRSPMMLLARLKLEIRSSCSQLTNRTFHYTRQDLWAGSSSGRVPFGLVPVAFVLGLWPSKGTTEQLVFEKWPAIFIQHQGKSVKQQNKKQSIEFKIFFLCIWKGKKDHLYIWLKEKI